MEIDIRAGNPPDADVNASHPCKTMYLPSGNPEIVGPTVPRSVNDALVVVSWFEMKFPGETVNCVNPNT
jgi:hypothetical protein